MDTTGKSAARQAAERLREALDGRYQGKQHHTQATITAVARDSAGRAVSATAIVDGVAAQSVAISAGASIAPGDTWIVRNAGGASLPRWEAARRLRAAAEVQAPDALPTLPTPAGLAVLSDLYRTAAGGEWRAYLRCSWLGIGAQYRVMGYDVQYMSGSPETLTVITATDRHPVTLLDGAIDDTQTVIPRDPDEAGYQDDFPSFGRIQIESERIDYLAVTAGEGDSGTGTGAANSFTDGTKSWDADQWADYALTDSAGDVFLVTANTGTVLTVAGTPASGAYTIKPAFSGCTRAAGGTAAAAHDDDTGVGSLSVGITIPELPPDTDYNVRVRAHSAFGGLSAWTAWASVTTAVDTLPPPVLTGMAHTPLTPDTVRLSWSKSSAKDLAYYEVAYSMAPGGLGPGGVYETVQTVNAYLDLGWPTNRALYWKVRAVDTWDNESDYCAEQTAYTVSVALPELSNPFFEEGNGAPDDWTLDSDGPVTTTWVASGGWNNSKAIKIEIGAANGADTWFIALESALFAVQQGVEYLPPGAMTYFAAVTDNALAFTVYQYSDAIGTPATEPLVRQVVNQSADRLNDWWHPGITAGGTYTVPAGSDVTHIAIAFEVNLDETHAQTVLLDNAVCDPVPAEMYKGVEAHAIYHLPGGPDALATAAANTIVPDAGAAEGSAASFARSDHTHAIACAAASTLSVSTTNSEGAGTDFARATHLHTITSSSNPGAAASLLASDASGYLTLVRLNLSENLVLGGDAGLTRHAANQLGPLSGDAIRSSTYTSGVAGYLISDNLAEFANARIRGELHAAVFVKDMIDARAGTLMVGKSAGALMLDMAVPASGTWYAYLKDPPGGGYLFADSDICYIKSEYSGGVAAIWFTVSARFKGSGYQRYTCTYNSGTRGITYPAGAPVTDWGVSGDGLVTVSADGTIGAGPNLSIITHAGSPWSATTLQGRFGNLNGSYGIATNVVGIGLGEYGAGKTSFLVTPTNGIQIFNGTNQVGQWDAAGNILVGRTGAGQNNVYITGGAVQLRTNTTVNLELTTAGQIILGDNAGGEYVTVDANGIEMYSGAIKIVDIANNGDFIFGQVAANKSNMFYDQSTGRLNFRGGAAGTTVQAYIDTTGEVMAGGGAVRINASGIQGYAGATQRFSLAADGSGWVGASDVLRWTTAGVVAFKAAGLVDPWEAPSLLDALYLPNAGGGGEQMFAWEGISGRLQTSYGSAVWLVQGGPYPTSFGCTNQGGPYRDFDGGTNAMLIFDSGVPEDQWQEPTGNTFLLWAWVNADVLATTNRTVLAKWEASGKYQYILYWDVTVGAFRFVISGNGTNTTVVDSSIAESTGVWYFIAGFYNPSTLLRIYVAPATASALTINSNTTSIPASIKDSTSPLEFGQFAGGSFWDGKIGVCAAWRGMPAASVDDYVELLFNKTKQFYGG
jgi:hypothetical protein